MENIKPSNNIQQYSIPQSLKNVALPIYHPIHIEEVGKGFMVKGVSYAICKHVENEYVTIEIVMTEERYEEVINYQKYLSTESLYVLPLFNEVDSYTYFKASAITQDLDNIGEVEYLLGEVEEYYPQYEIVTLVRFEVEPQTQTYMWFIVDVV